MTKIYLWSDSNKSFSATRGWKKFRNIYCGVLAASSPLQALTIYKDIFHCVFIRRGMGVWLYRKYINIYFKLYFTVFLLEGEWESDYIKYMFQYIFQIVFHCVFIRRRVGVWWAVLVRWQEGSLVIMQNFRQSLSGRANLQQMELWFDTF